MNEVNWDVCTALKHALTPDLSPVTILLSISSPSSAYRKRCCKDRPIRFFIFFSILQFSGHAPCTLSETSNDHALCCMLNHMNILLQLLHCLFIILLSGRINSFTRCTVTSVAISTGIMCDFQTSLREFLHPVVNDFMQQMLPTINRKHFFMNILCIDSFSLQKTHNTMLLFRSTPLKHGRHFDYWNQPLCTCMHICCLDCHEAGLCCYLVIHTENLSRPLQLFYFHLWPIYWLSLVSSSTKSLLNIISFKIVPLHSNAPLPQTFPLLEALFEGCLWYRLQVIITSVMMSSTVWDLPLRLIIRV
jgi:hypothetical protein